MESPNSKIWKKFITSTSKGTSLCDYFLPLLLSHYYAHSLFHFYHGCVSFEFQFNPDWLLLVSNPRRNTCLSTNNDGQRDYPTHAW